MTDWVKYLDPSFKKYNCWTFVEKIFQDRLQVWDAELSNLFNTAKTKWGQSLSFEDIDKIAKTKLIEKVSLLDLKEYDILVFGINIERPIHFGVYIGRNQFIHLKKIPMIDDLNDEWRKKLKVIYRHDNRSTI